MCPIRWRLSGLGCFDDPSRLNTIGTYHHLLNAAVINRSHALQVRIKATLGQIMGVAHVIPHKWFFTTDLTYFSHG